MSYKRIPVGSFDKLYRTTSTVVFPLPNVTGLNLPAIFSLLTTLVIKNIDQFNFEHKSGKIIYPPEFNIPGEIISMKYGRKFRGVIRSQSIPFPTAISIDIGTKVRPVSVKFSQTIKITGPPTFETAEEAVNSIINKIQSIQRWLNLTKANKEILDKVYDEIKNSDELDEHEDVDLIITSPDSENIRFVNINYMNELCEIINDKESSEREQLIYRFIKNLLILFTLGSDKNERLDFIENLLIPFNGILYNGDIN